MARFLVDTNVISEPMRKKPNSRVLEYLKAHETELAISATILHELLYGIERLPESKKRQAIRLYVEQSVVSSLPIFSYELEAARWHALERARLTAIGKTPAYADAQIAAVAAVNDLTLVTRNLSDFKDFAGLDIVSWHE